MAEKPLVCPFCKIPLEPGYVIDFLNKFGTKPAEWVSGAPHGSLLRGADPTGHKRREIEAWRCTQCGILQEYAR